ncbi:MAG: hypothetical protein IPG56_20550 [Caulobacteraceae bacterium]|nr:hypothetical protein [Caulobacteraceae bacterium]
MSADNLEAKARAAWGADIEPLLERLDGEEKACVRAPRLVDDQFRLV